MADTIGRPPTPQESGLVSAAAALAPEKTLARLDEFGKYLLGLASLAATLFTGFGIMTAESVSSSPWFLVPAFLFCVALGLAVSGITPRPGSVKLNDLNDVERHYTDLVITRGRFVWWAGLTFAAAIFTVPLGLFMAKGPALLGTDVGLRPTALLTHSDKLSLTGAVEAKGIPRGQCVRTRVTGPGGAVLLDDFTHPDGAGNAKVTLNVSPIQPGISSVSISSIEQPCSLPVTLSVTGTKP